MSSEELKRILGQPGMEKVLALKFSDTYDQGKLFLAWRPPGSTEATARVYHDPLPVIQTDSFAGYRILGANGCTLPIEKIIPGALLEFVCELLTFAKPLQSHSLRRDGRATRVPTRAAA